MPSVHPFFTNSRISFFFCSEQYSIVYTDYISFIHLSISWHLGYFCVLAIVTHAAMNMAAPILLWESDFVSFGSIPKSGMLDHMTVLFLIFWRISILVSIMAALTTSSTQGFLSLFLPILVTSWLFDNNHSNKCEVIFHCGFDLHFPDDSWCWPSFRKPIDHLYVFGKMSLQVFCSFFMQNKRRKAPQPASKKCRGLFSLTFSLIKCEKGTGPKSDNISRKTQ